MKLWPISNNTLLQLASLGYIRVEHNEQDRTVLVRNLQIDCQCQYERIGDAWYPIDGTWKEGADETMEEDKTVG